MLGLLSQQLVEQQALDDDRLAGQQGGGGDRGSCGSGGQDKTTYNIEEVKILWTSLDLFVMYFSVFLYLFYIYQIKLTGGSEGHADGVDDGSGSPGDGEEAARQSEDDKALQIFENEFLVFCILYLRTKVRTTKSFRISRIRFFSVFF